MLSSMNIPICMDGEQNNCDVLCPWLHIPATFQSQWVPTLYLNKHDRSIDKPFKANQMFIPIQVYRWNLINDLLYSPPPSTSSHCLYIYVHLYTFVRENINVQLYEYHYLSNHCFLLFLFRAASLPSTSNDETRDGGGRRGERKANTVLYHHLGSTIVSAVLIYTKIYDPESLIDCPGQKTSPWPSLFCEL